MSIWACFTIMLVVALNSTEMCIRDRCRMHLSRRRKYLTPTIRWQCPKQRYLFQGNSILTHICKGRSVNNRTIINGVSVVTPEKIDCETYELFCCAIYCYVYNRRYYSNRLIKDVIDDEQKYREQKMRPCLLTSRIYFLISLIMSSIYPIGQELNKR